MKIKFTFLLFLATFITFSQSAEQVDSLTVEICKSIQKNKNFNTEEKLDMVDKQHLRPFLNRISDSIKQKEMFDKIFFRLQKNCNEFTFLLNETTTNQSDWEIKQEMPTYNLSNKQCISFNSNSNFYYKEYEGDVVNVVIKNGFWIETFADKTNSKLKYIKKDNCSFELEFVESNNVSRKNLSNKGDIYKYQLFEESNNVFGIYTENKGTFYLFKLYPTK